MLTVELRNNLPVTEVGGKGYSLRILIENSFNVPTGFVITSQAFFAFLRHNNLTEKVERLSSKIGRENFKKNSKEIRELILGGRMPEDIVSEIESSLNNSDIQYVSTRSSAVSEDSSKASFAGMHSTFLNVEAEPSLVSKNTRKCWASLFSERAVAYRIRKELPPLEGMAVIVQEMIPAEISGTTFTTHPDTRDKDIMIIESSWGVGEAIVSGLVTPDRYIVAKKTSKIVDKILGRKKVTLEANGTGITQIDTPKNKMNVFCLNNSLIKDLTEICLKIEELFNYPQDIEWCIRQNKLWILQSRPITSLGAKT